MNIAATIFVSKDVETRKAILAPTNVPMTAPIARRIAQYAFMFPSLKCTKGSPIQETKHDASGGDRYMARLLDKEYAHRYDGQRCTRRKRSVEDRLPESKRAILNRV